MLTGSLSIHRITFRRITFHRKRFIADRFVAHFDRFIARSFHGTSFRRKTLPNCIFSAELNGDSLKK